MRFSTAWARTAMQNVTLKIATVTLAAIALTLTYEVTSLASRDLPVIERGCFSKMANPSNGSPTKTEIDAFLSESLPMRFDSSAYLKEGFLSVSEMSAREKEQTELKSHQMFQRFILEDIAQSGREITVNADRLITVGKIKSALTFNLRVGLQTTNRTEANPYGLILSFVSPIEQKDSK